MRVVHEPADGPERVLATNVDVADSILRKGLGLMGRGSVPDDYALVFPFESASRRSVHMVLVRTPIDVAWCVGDRVERVETLSAWTGTGRARADRIVELAPGAADGVEPGDELRVEA